MKKCNNKIGVVLVYMAVLIFNLFFSDISSAATQQELLVNIAVSQVGIQERSVGSDDIFYNDWYYGRRVTNGFSGQYAWCAVFVSWCANQVGISTDIIPKTASTTNMKDGLISRGGTQHLKGSGYTPQTGDIIFFGSNASQHVGIVNYTSGSTVYYIDGNNVSMSPHGVHSSSCSLSYSSLWGFVTPNYTNNVIIDTTPPINVVADLERSNFVIGENITFYYGADNYTGVFVQIYYNNELAYNDVTYDKSGYSFKTVNASGNYKYVVRAFNDYGVTFSKPYYFTVQNSYSKPQNVKLDLDKSQYKIGEEINYTYSADFVTNYELSVYKDGNIYEVVELEPYSTYSKKYTEPGAYETYIVAKNALGETYSNSGVANKFQVITSPPFNVVADLEKSNFITNDNITFYYGADNYTGVFVQIYYNNELAYNDVTYDKSGYSFKTVNASGNYKYVVRAFNDYGVTFSKPYYFTVQNSYSKPQNVKLDLDKDQYKIGEEVNYTYSADFVTNYELSVYKDGNIYEVINLEPYSTYSKVYTEAGNYETYIVAKNSAGETFSNSGFSNKFSVVSNKYYAEIETPIESTIFEGDDEITISGYACSQDEISSVQLRVNSAIYDVEFFDREDIRELYKNAIDGNEGIRLTLPKSAFKNGDNTANIIINMADGNRYEFDKINFTVYKSYEPVNVGYYNGKIYAVYDDVNSWSEAKEFCETRGGNLVAITTKAEQNYITSLLKNSNVSQYWIGATRGSGDTYSWVTGESFAYNNWNTGEPNNNNGTENCVVMFKNGKWNDGDAVNPYPCGFIYEFDANALEVSQYSTFGESEYYLYNKSVPFAIAEKYAEINGGIILNIGGAEEENVIYDMIAKTNGAVDRVWISLNDKENEGDFKWDNKEPLDYENWITGQPDDYNGVEDYTTLIYNSGWNDVKADYNETDKIGFVVKYSTDINQSGKNDNIDATMLIRHISGIENLTNDQYSRADINGDGKVDIKDVTEILNKM